jgi:multiple sugar transport system permease protein
MKSITRSLRPHPNLARWAGHAILALFAVISLGPIWIAVKTALSDSKTLFSGAGSFLPTDFTLFNIQRVLGFINPADPRVAQTSFGKIDFFRALVNSVIFTVPAVAPQIACSAMAFLPLSTRRRSREGLSSSRLASTGATSYAFCEQISTESF